MNGADGPRKLAYKMSILQYLTWSLRQHDISVVVQQIAVDLLRTVDTLTELTDFSTFNLIQKTYPKKRKKNDSVMRNGTVPYAELWVFIKT